MSHPINDMMVDRILDDIADMDDKAVMNALKPKSLSKVMKFVGGGANDSPNNPVIVDYARDVLADQMYGDWLDMPGPCG